MPRALRAFIPTSPPPPLPYEWQGAVEMPGHRTQGDFLFVAPTKIVARDMLIERGVHEYEATGLTRNSHVCRAPYWNGIEDLIEAGVVDMTVPGIYAWYDHRPDMPVVRVDPGGILATVAYWRNDKRRPGRSTYAEPVTPQKEA